MNQATNLGAAVQAVYPDHPEISAFHSDGPDSVAWAAYARILGLTATELAKRIAPAFGVESAGIVDGATIDSGTLAQVPYHFCQKHTVIPLAWKDGVLQLAAANPNDADLQERLRFLVGKPVSLLLAPPSVIEDAVLVAFSREAVKSAQTLGRTPALDENAIVQLSRELMTRAVQLRASDLHVQPYLGSSVVRIRVDGTMRRLTVLPDAVAAMLIRHVKVRGGMDPSNTQIPLDGRMSFVAGGKDFELRLSTLPASRGERLVMRFLAQSQVHRLSSAGFSHAALQTMRRAVARPYGLVVFTGPTGSGKTSTLYGMLAEVNSGDINIITVENPVEYRIPGISQVEVNDKAGRTFAAALRSILRQDPDVILIGEIRDRETAEIAVQSAMTGHLVLTTLHTNDALTAIPRLLDLGVQPSVLADALVVVASQRLCRKLCEQCKIPVQEPLNPEERAFVEVTHNQPAYRAVGCEHCDFTGFRGRLPIVDIIETNRKLRDAVASGETRLTVLEETREGGLKSLAASGSLRIISGDTTVREVMNAVGPAFWPELATHYGAYFSTDLTETIPTNAAKGFGVLLIGGTKSLANHLRPALEEEGLRLVQVDSASAAEAALHNDEDIAFVVGELEDGTTLEAAAAQLQDNRLHIAWARLPAAVFLPASLGEHADALRASGTLAALLPKPVQPEDLIAYIRRSQAR